MNASFKKRLIAYIIDFLFIMSILMIIYNVFLKNDIVKGYELKLNEISQSYMKKEITFLEYSDLYSEYIYKIDYNSIIKNILNVVLIFIYYIVFPFIFNGQTFGKRIMKIKIVDRKKEGKVSFVSLIIRSLIINALLVTLVSIILVLLLKYNVYFITSSIFVILQLLLVIISSSMLLYRKDKLSLEDVLSNSKVISIK